MKSCPPRVAVLLSTYNGERFLTPQLHSLLGQTHRDWVLYWRDDGSNDGTRALMQAFLNRLGPDRSVVLGDNANIGATESFMRLLRRAHADGHPVLAFADQDDVWLPEKLARGVAGLAGVKDGVAGLYFARYVLVDADLRHIAISARLRRPPGFPAALTQNLATGCTVLMNRAAMDLVAGSTVPDGSLHDWWSYIVVAANGGAVLADVEPTVLYRQHDANVVGAPRSRARRAIAALRRGPGPYMRLLRNSVSALAIQPALLCPAAQAQVAQLAWGLEGGLGRRMATLRMPGLRRQTVLETLLFRLWFLLR